MAVIEKFDDEKRRFLHLEAGKKHLSQSNTLFCVQNVIETFVLLTKRNQITLNNLLIFQELKREKKMYNFTDAIKLGTKESANKEN